MIPNWKWLLGGSALLFLATKRNEVASMASSASNGISTLLSNTFNAAKIPSAIAKWSPQIQKAASKYGVSPWILSAIMLRETGGGVYLTPKYDPRGTGDFIPRGPGRVGAQYANPATGLPQDGKGWGRGLMQIDWGIHYDWMQVNDWGDPQVNIDKAALIYRDFKNFFKASAGPDIFVEEWRLNDGLPENRIQGWKQKYGINPSFSVRRLRAGSSTKYEVGPFKDPRPLNDTDASIAAMAAYNAGSSGVLKALALGLPPDAPTTGQDYVSWVAAKLQAWL